MLEAFTCCLFVTRDRLGTFACDMPTDVFCTAAITLFLEFPCAIVMGPDSMECNASFQMFYLCVYFVVCTFSTVRTSLVPDRLVTQLNSWCGMCVHWLPMCVGGLW